MLSQRPQCGWNNLPTGSSTYTQSGILKVKTSDGRWLTYPRFVAEQFAIKCGVIIPSTGVRVEVLNDLDIRPATLMLKFHGGERLRLTRYVQNQKRLDVSNSALIWAAAES